MPRDHNSKKRVRMKKSRGTSRVLGVFLMCAVFGLMVGGQRSCAPAQDPEAFWATAYYCPYESELEGEQTVDMTISGTTYTLKASFLFGGHSVAMEGVGRTGPEGQYIWYDSRTGGSWAHLDDPQEFTRDVRTHYSDLGITDFTGFGNLALTHPDQASYSVVSGVVGANDNILSPWYSIAVDPSAVALGTTGILQFDNGTTPAGATWMSFRADDTGPDIKGSRVDIYVGEGEASLGIWERTGDNRYVHFLKD